ncbi:MAG: RNA 2'-phosphotransferase [Desulfurococcales archaeon]|nr:RNA 2'-phosphotransferase [Desulfurococcales archaeon]
MGLYKCRTRGGELLFTRDMNECENPVLIYSGKELLMISKLMSRILRHEPFKYDVKIDRHGWASLNELVNALQSVLGDTMNINKESIIGIIETDPKSRFEYRHNKVRARYGHSIGIDIRYRGAEPLVLFHGTQINRLNSILSRGLLPGKRLYVHLSPTPEDACMVARRRRGIPIYLIIDCTRLRELGYRIYKATSKVFLVERVPSSAIQGFQECK